MQFELTEEQNAFQAMAREFAYNEMLAEAARWDEEEIFPVATLRKAAELGLAGIYVRGESGGSGLTRLDATLIFEELASNSILRLRLVPKSVSQRFRNLFF